MAWNSCTLILPPDSASTFWAQGTRALAGMVAWGGSIWCSRKVTVCAMALPATVARAAAPRAVNAARRLKKFIFVSGLDLSAHLRGHTPGPQRTCSMERDTVPPPLCMQSHPHASSMTDFQLCRNVMKPVKPADPATLALGWLSVTPAE